MSRHHHQAVNRRVTRMGRSHAARKPVARKCSACGSFHVPPTGRSCPALWSPPASEIDQIEVGEPIGAGEGVLIERLTPNGACGLPISSSPIATTTGRPKRTMEQNIDVMAE